MAIPFDAHGSRLRAARAVGKGCVRYVARGDRRASGHAQQTTRP
jgi:hypothetical protein